MRSRFSVPGKSRDPDGLPLGQARQQERVTPLKPLPRWNERDCARGTTADVAVTVDDRAGTCWLRTGCHETPVLLTSTFAIVGQC